MGYFDDLHNKNTDYDTSGATQAAEAPDEGGVDDAGMQVAPAESARPSYFTGGDLNNRAAYGPDVLGGNTVTAPLPQRNAAVGASLLEPRNPMIDRAYQDSSYRAQPGIPTAVPQAPPGPLSRAVEGAPGVSRIGNAYTGTGTPQPSQPYNPNTAGLAYAYDGAQKAAVFQNQQQGDNAMMNGARTAQTSFDLRNAEQAARVSRFQAKNGADMVLAPENIGYDKQRQSIVDAANQDAGTVATLRGQLTANQNAQLGARNYIDEYGKTQQELNRASITGSETELRGAEAGLKKLSVDEQKNLLGLQQQLAKETDPAQQKLLQNKILAIQGKRPNDGKFMTIDIDTGAKGVTGEPIFKKGVFNTETNEIVDGSKQGKEGSYPTPIPKSIEALKADPSKRKDFDDYYGPGAAAKILGK